MVPFPVREPRDSSVKVQGSLGVYHYDPSLRLEGVTHPHIAQDDAGRAYVLKLRSRWPEGFDNEAAVYRRIQEAGGHPHCIPLQEIIRADTDIGEEAGKAGGAAKGMNACSREGLNKKKLNGEPNEEEYLVLPYIPGEDLDQVVLYAGALSPGNACAVLHPVCDAVQYLHGLGILHRDLTLANIRLQAQVINGQNLGRDVKKKWKISLGGASERVLKIDLKTEEDSRMSLPGDLQNVFLYDFNLAIPDAIVGASLAERPVGTPAYVAPEVWKYSHADFRSDIYALGICLFRLLTGEAPFFSKERDDDDFTLEVMEKHLRQEIPSVHRLNPELPPAIDDFFFKALAKEPEKRFQSVREFKQGLQGLV